jgi:nicotinamidase-related amidase|tara:strand:+ start:9005 stop:9676 length:672 start_codon:yes stop_codon:yes gene_type:complete
MREYTLPKRESVALLTIDLQRDFCRSDSPVVASGFAAALPQVTALVKAFRQHSLPIFHSLRLYRPDGSNVDLFRRAAVEEGLRVLMPGTSGAGLIEEMRTPQYEHLNVDDLFAGGFQENGAREWLFYKPRWGAFHDTPLHEKLRAMKIDTLVVCGCNFPTGGRATVYEGCSRDYRISIIGDAFAGANDEGLCELNRIGAYSSSAAACLDWLTGPAAARSTTAA